VDVKVVWDPVWTMDRLSEEARGKLAMPLEELEPYRVGRSA
jgi:metal-sulfur cluster biosynthetic enzyme